MQRESWVLTDEQAVGNTLLWFGQGAVEMLHALVIGCCPGELLVEALGHCGQL